MWGVRVFVTLYALAVALLAPAMLFAAGDQTVQSKQTAPPEATTTNAEPAGTEAAAAASAPTTPTYAPAIGASPPAPAAAKPRSPERAARAAKPHVVARAAVADTIADFAFSPPTITVTAGKSVTWHNDGPSQHSATADDHSFDTGVLSKGAEGSHTFDQAGTFSYFCTVHPNMKGTVRVLAASSSGGGSGSSSGNDGGSSSNSTGSSGSSSPGSGSSGSSSSSTGGSSLPSTGLNIAVLVLLGIGLLSCGTGLRLRLAGRENGAKRYSPSSRR
jgi:plastocyanin